MIDDRRHYDGEKTITCSNCNAINWEYMHCFNCQKPLFKQKVNINFMYGKPGKTIGERTYRNAQDYERRHGEDLIQPTIYNKSSKKIETNPDFVKRYGNPFTSKARVGEAVEQAINSGEIELKGEEPI